MSGIGTLNIDVLANIASAVDNFVKVHDAASKHARGMRDEFIKAQDEIKEAFRTSAEIIGVGFSLEGMRELVMHSIEGAEKAQNLSQVLGVTTQTIQTLSFAAGMVGGNIDTVTTAFTHMERAGEQAIAGNAQASEGFRALGVNSSQLAELLKKPDDLFLQISRHVAEMGDGSAKTSAIWEVMGKGSAQLIPMLELVGTQYDEIRKRAEAFGVTLSSQNQSALVAAGEGMSELKQAAVGLGNQFTIALLPAITEVEEKLLNFGASGAAGGFFTNLQLDVSQAVVLFEHASDAVADFMRTIIDVADTSSTSTAHMTHDLVGYVQQSLNEWEHIKGAVQEAWVDIVDGGTATWIAIEGQEEKFVAATKEKFAPMASMLSNIAFAMGDFGESAALDKLSKEWEHATDDVGGYKDKLGALQMQHDDAIAAIRAGVKAATEDNQKWADGIRLTAAATSLMTTGMDEFVSSLKAGDIPGNAQKLADAMGNLRSSGEDLIAQGADEAKVHADVDNAIAALTKTVQRANAARGEYNANVAAGTAIANAAARASEEMQRIIDGLAGKVGGQYAQSWAAYNTSLDKIHQKYDLMIKDVSLAGKAEEMQAEAIDLLNDGMRRQQDATEKLDIVVQNATAGLNERVRLSGLTVEQQKIEIEYAGLLSEADKALLDVMGPLNEADQKRITSLYNVAAATVHLDEATQNSKQVFEDYRQIYSAGITDLIEIGGRFFTGQEKGFKGMFDDILSAAKNFFTALAFEYAKLNLLNPILNTMFGGALGMLPTGGGGIMGMIGGGGASAGGGATGTAGGTAGGGTDLFGTASGGISLFNAGKTIFGGFSSAASSFWYGSPYNPASSTFMGPPVAGQAMGPGAPYGGGFGQALGVAGGVYAGYSEYNRAGGGAAGLVGGAAYGVGTYALGAGLTSAAAGTGFAAGMSGAVAIPVIGWIAAAAMIVDMLSGGKLFGTEGKFDHAESALTIGSGGAVASAGYDVKGQKPLFGGSTHEWHTSDVDPAAQAAADQFFAMLKQGDEQFAKDLHATMIDVVGGVFDQTYDKHGNVTGSTTTIAGHTYSGESAGDFQTREIAENKLAILGQFDAGLDKAVDQFRTNADEIGAIADSLASAEAMMQSGTKFLALGADQSLTALLSLAEGSTRFGETVGQALQRIMQSQAQYDQFVGGFKKTNFVDDYEAALSNINTTMKANVAQANALAEAAGAAGASEEDLGNITAFAAQQAADALKALEASAQSLAFSMGLTTVGSLDDVTSEINRLQAKAQTGSQGMNGFGDAIQAVADRAKAAMDLMLGALSPLDDQEKLQKALEGLRAGTTSRDQVLEIGRRLYASSQAYTDLFNQVMATPDRSGQGSFGSTHHDAPGGLSAAEQTRLSDLLKEQTELQKQADFANAQTLATQIAEIAASKGEDFHQVATDMHLDLAGLEKRLNMSDDDFAKYIADQQAKLDDNKENTTSIVSAINDAANQIVVALGGKPISHPGLPGTPETFDGGGPSRPNRGGHSTRNISDADANAIGNAVVDGIVRGTRGTMPRGLQGLQGGRG